MSNGLRLHRILRDLATAYVRAETRLARCRIARLATATLEQESTESASAQLGVWLHTIRAAGEVHRASRRPRV